MKKRKVLTSLFLLSSMLFSCSGRNEDGWKKEVLNDIPESMEISYTTYKVTTHGSVSVKNDTQNKYFDTFSTPESSYSLPSGQHVTSPTESYDLGKSYLMNVPIRVNKSVFMSDTDNDIGSAYKVLNETLCYYSDPVTKLQFKKNDDGSFDFFTRSVSKLIEIRHLYDPEGPDSEYVQVYGRFNMTLCYTADGLLRSETYETIDHEGRTDNYVSVWCTYDYQ